MKKQYLAIAFLAVALGLTACSSKKADTETTTAGSRKHNRIFL